MNILTTIVLSIAIFSIMMYIQKKRDNKAEREMRLKLKQIDAKYRGD